MNYFEKHILTFEEDLKELEDLNIKYKYKNVAWDCLTSIPKQEFLRFKNSILFDAQAGKFKDGITVELLSEVYKLNNGLSQLLLKYILYTEQSFKTKLAYLIYENYGSQTSYKLNKNTSDDYLSVFNYSSRNNKGRPHRTSVLISLRENVHKSEKSIDPFTLVNRLNFGTAINWYYILKGEDKLQIAYQLGTQLFFMKDEDLIYFITSSLEILRKRRNQIAHSDHTPSLDISMSLLRKAIGNSKVLDGLTVGEHDYFIIALILFIFTDIKYFVTGFCLELRDILKKYQDLVFPERISIYEIFGIPKDYFERFKRFELYLRHKNQEAYSRLLKKRDDRSKEKLQIFHFLAYGVLKEKN